MTYDSDAQRDVGYSNFFMGKGGKRHVAGPVGGKSSVDNIMLGRDIDNSGEDPHKQFMSRFGSHAGMKSGEKPDRPFRKPCYAMNSTMDSVIWGRDFDQSGENPHKMFSQTYSGHAGIQAGDRPHRPFRKGQYALQSVVDEVVFGHDMDRSGADPHGHYQHGLHEHAGYCVHDKPTRPFRQPKCTLMASSDEVVYGRDMDLSGSGDPQPNFMAAYPEHAGLKYGEIVQRPYRKYGISQKATADSIIFNRDVDHSGHDPRSEEYMQLYAEHAGAVSGNRRATGKHVDPRDPRYVPGVAGEKTCSCDADASKSHAIRRSASEKPSRSWMSNTTSPRGSEMTSPLPPPPSAPPQQASIVPTERKNPFKFNPNSRRSSTAAPQHPLCAQLAAAGSHSHNARRASRVARPQRALSPGRAPPALAAPRWRGGGPRSQPEGLIGRRGKQILPPPTLPTMCVRLQQHRKEDRAM
eukprot:CAMPEP_0115197554 /NCGR_PEP_ID=MMETSP0270-20121206/15655_1 /TAXON_ID=71861 /ORGANISM="Scrippsiella trochoidea, Strain CCMP3099" /LENGTH=465 /DNA_ID=CAMNT_0002610909 /DNA_START=11 /DNA_END=1409 /DNA_ORIENTATION=-